MATLPRYHVARDRLVERLRETHIGVVEAAGGYGKSVLAAEFAAHLGIASASARLAERDRGAAALLARLEEAFEDAGLSDLSWSGAGNTPSSATDDLLRQLRRRRDPVLLVIDDVHELTDTDGVRLLVELARRLPERHRLLLLGRRVPARAAELLTMPEATLLATADLSFTEAEIARVLDGLKVSASADGVGRLWRAAAGWPAAVLLIASRLPGVDDADDSLRRLGPSTMLPELIDRMLEDLDAVDRQALIEIARFGTVDPPAVAEALDRPGIVDRLIAAGIPFSPAAGGGWEVPGPVGEYLASLGAVSGQSARRLAQAYLARGRPNAALAAVLASGDLAEVGRFLAGLTVEQGYQLDYVDIAGSIDLLPDGVLDDHPRALVHFARACESSFQTRRRARALERAAGSPHASAELAREIDAERAQDLIRDGSPAEAATLAQTVLADAGEDEPNTRARALDVVGRARAWERDRVGLAEAQILLEEAYALCRTLGNRTWMARIVMPLAIDVLRGLGQFEAAIERLDEALEGLAGRDRLRAAILTFRAEVLVEIGRYAEAEANLRDADAVGTMFGDRRLIAYAAWGAAVSASQQGDAARTVELLERARQQEGDWFAHVTGAEFLGAAAEALARVGELDRARDYLASAVERLDEAPLRVGLAQLALEARAGDPARAMEMAVAAEAMPRVEPHERWRPVLFHALAAHRAGSAEAALLTKRALDEAAALGQPALPFIGEPDVASELARTYPLTSHATIAVDPISISALGGFAIVSGSGPIRPPPGLPSTLLKYLVASGGNVLAEEAMEALWPEGSAEAGRRGLRNVLLRLNVLGRRIVVREGTRLTLSEGADVDVFAFMRIADRAIARRADAEAVVDARSAVALYRGPLLPGEPYAEWAAVPRERLRVRFVQLLDMLIRHATLRRDIDEAAQLAERAIDEDPYDEERYLSVARLLEANGRRGAAVAMRQRAARMLRSLEAQSI